MSKDVVIVETGIANVASVTAALSRCGATARVSSAPDAIAGASHVVLPGVGAFGSGMDRLRARGLDRVLVDRINADRPVLAICLGLQLLAMQSDESPGVHGLGVLPVGVRPLPPGVRSPHFGWNLVTPRGSGTIEPGYAYFANSFCLERAPSSWTTSIVQHGGPMIAAVERGSTLACQFHPELSGDWGIELIGRWLGRSSAETKGAPAC